MTALQSYIYFRSRVTPTVFCSSLSGVQSFVFIFNLLTLLKFLIVYHTLLFSYGFAVISAGMDIPGFAVKLPIIHIILFACENVFFTFCIGRTDTSAALEVFGFESGDVTVLKKHICSFIVAVFSTS